MTQPKFKSCFISAPFGTDTASLRAALEQRNVHWRDHTSLAMGHSWIELLDEEMSRADFICTIIPDQQNGNVLFELGMAVGKKKPILAFVSSSVGLPIDTLTYFVLDPTTGSLDKALDTFLQHSKPTPKKRRKVASQGLTAGKGSTLPQGYSGYLFEKQAAELFRHAGYIVSEQASGRDEGADFAVWIDELTSLIGGPLLVEVKSGSPSSDLLRRSEDQLRHYVQKTNGKLGLLVWWGNMDAPPSAISSDRSQWPIILTLTGDQLRDLLARGELALELARLRNAASHGGV